jgi:hypothetical protein
MKKIKKLRAVFGSLLPIAIFTILLVIGCNKKNVKEATADNSLAKMARTYFSDLAKKEITASDQVSTAQQKKGSLIRVTPLTKMSPFIIWENATEIKRDKLTYTIVPLKGDKKPFKNKNYEFFRNLIFYRDESGKDNMTILEVLSTKGKSLGNDFKKIAISAFENKYFSGSQDIQDLNAYVIFFNENYERETSFQLVDGKWTPARISFRSDLDITQ